MDASPRPLSDELLPPAPLAQKYLGSPTDFLKGVVGKRVIVRLTSGVDYQGPTFFYSLFMAIFSFFLNQRILGILSCLDGFMNIALEQTEEYVNGTVTNRYGDTFVRGNNGAFILTLSV
jgi:U6 snRNA-associated Sm-like protein LSm6